VPNVPVGTLGTRSDIAFSVSPLSQLLDNYYDVTHWAAAKRVLRYLKGSINSGLERIQRDATDRLCRRGLSELHRRQTVIHRLRLHTQRRGDFVGLEKATDHRPQFDRGRIHGPVQSRKAVDLLERAGEDFLIELEVNVTRDIVLKCDNMGAQNLSKNPVYHSWTKHIDVRHHFVREVLNNGNMRIEHFSITEMAADMLTKALPKPKHDFFMKGLGLRSTLGMASRGEVISRSPSSYTSHQDYRASVTAISLTSPILKRSVTVVVALRHTFSHLCIAFKESLNAVFTHSRVYLLLLPSRSIHASLCPSI